MRPFKNSWKTFGTRKKKNMYIVITNGDCESVYTTHSEFDAFDVARDYVNQRLTDFYRHKLPMRVVDGEFDVRLIEVGVGLDDGSTRELPIPIQPWLDEYYTRLLLVRNREEASAKDPEWIEYQRLKEKFE